MFLTADELRELTGAARLQGQVAWLKGHRYPFELDAKGRPKVLRAFVQTKLGGTAANDTSPKLRLPSHAA
jgi:hypothetical protein